jgi:ABC-type nitrate/sulfonate/bicarbonate transport system ATPase subunit
MNALSLCVRHKTYAGGVEALRQCQLSAKPGEFVAIVGPSGAGKSTLLNIVAGLDRDFDGELTLPVLTHHSSQGDERACSPLSFMFQEPRLMPWLSVRDNVGLVLRQPQTCESEISALLDTMGLSDFAQAYPAQLSGGMRRRVALARAFIGQPSLLLMDEPFTSLDAPTASALRQLLLHMWHQQRPTILFVTHQLTEALALAERVVFMSKRPARVIFEHRCSAPWPRDLDLAAYQSAAEALMREQPGLLNGQLLT